MKFILMTKSGLETDILGELISSGLTPEIVVTESPFDSNKMFLKKFIADIIIYLKILKNPSYYKSQYKAYFLAKKKKIRLWPSSKVNTLKFRDIITSSNIDYIFTFTFDILKKIIIESPKYECINFHPSLLPKNRGATPYNWVILNNQKYTGVTFHLIDENIDSGSIIEQQKIPISAYENAKDLKIHLCNIGAYLLVKLIYKLKKNINIKLKKNQLEKGEYQNKFYSNIRYINIENSYDEIDRLIRSSRMKYNFAQFILENKKYNVINSVIINQNTTQKFKHPFLDDDSNIIFRNKENKLILLITTE